MMGFIEWVEFESKRKQRGKKNVESTDQRGTEVGNVHHQGQAAGNDTKEYSTVVHDFTQSKWEDYRGGD